MAIRARPARESDSRGELTDAGAPAWPTPHASGVRPATRLPDAMPGDGGLVSARVDTRTGLLIDEAPSVPATLAEFAAALPELLVPVSAVSRLVLEPLVGPPRVLKELVLISPRGVHVAQLLPEHTGVAVVSAADRSASLGWVVSEARARLTRR